MNTPFFSIVITTYNAENFLANALNSLKNQTVQDFEWIVTDDFSTDQTLAVCRKWLNENPEFQSRVRIIETSENTGVSANVNRGLKCALGEWIYVFSADDALPENALENVLKFIEKNPNVQIFQGIASVYDTDFTEQNFIENITENNGETGFFSLSAEEQYRSLLKHCKVVAPAVFYKRTLVEEVGYCDERIPMIDDLPLWLKITGKGYKIYFCDAVLIQYRIHKKSITNENKGVFVSDLHRKRRLIYRYYIAPNIGFFAKIKYHLSYTFDDFLYRFFNSRNNRFSVYVLMFLRFVKRLFISKKNLHNPKHVAFFMQDFVVNGVSIVFLNYARILSSMGYRMDMIVARENGLLQERFSEYAHIVNLGNIRQRNAIFRLRKHIRNSSISTLISGSELANFIAVLAMFGLKKSCKLIVTQHAVFDQDDLALGRKGRFVNLAKRVLYKHSTKIIAVSDAVAKELKTLHLPERKIQVLPNPIFPSEIVRSSEEPFNTAVPERYILFVGRLANVKNVSLLLDAFAQISDDTLHLLILGDGDLRSMLEEKAKPISTRVHFLGAVANPMPYIKYAQVVAIPSFSESVSLVALEACVLGKTIVHTPNTGCMDILGTDGGYCSQSFDDPKAFAELLKTALRKPIAPSILQSKIQRFDAKKVGEELLMIND